MPPDPQALQELCIRGSRELAENRYTQAERTLEQAEDLAHALSDYDTLSRLLFPLQEARRQIRQRCGEGVVRLDLIAGGPDEAPDVQDIAARYLHGQLLVAGWRSTAPAAALRRLLRDSGSYAETFLAAAFPIPGNDNVVALLPRDTDLSHLPESLDLPSLVQRLSVHSLVLPAASLPVGPMPGNAATFARTMALWERLHQPLLDAARAQPDPRARLAAFRVITSEVDRGCELAHQLAAETARQLARSA